MTFIYCKYIIKNRKEGDFTKYCPNCHRDFSDSFDTCVYCGTALINGINPNPIQINQYIPKSNIETEKENQKYQPHCPICGSPNVEKISTASKVGKAALFGVFSLGTIGKTYHCKSCGAKF